MTLKFRYGGLDVVAWMVSILVLAALVYGCWWLFVWAEGALYIAAWGTSVVVAIVALCLLSLPRRIILSDEELELRCLMETTYIPLRSVVDVKVMGSEGLKGKVPVLGLGGLGGYLGFWVDTKSWRLYRTYVTSRHKCVAIHTSRHRYMVSCGAAELLRTQILAAKARNSKEEK